MRSSVRLHELAVPFSGSAALAVAGWLWIAGPAWAQARPLGLDFQVNTYTTSSQAQPGVAAGANSGFVVTWFSWGDPVASGAALSIAARRFDSAGEPIGDQFQVSEQTVLSRVQPSAAIAPGGDFLVAWRDGAPVPESLGNQIRARLFTSSGSPLATEIVVNSYGTQSQSWPAAAALPDGSFVVAWQSDGSAGDDSSNVSTQARRVSATGTALASDFQVNTYTIGGQRRPQLAVQPGGDFVVGWLSSRAVYEGGTLTSRGTLDARVLRADEDGGISATGPVVEIGGGNGLYEATSVGISGKPDGLIVGAWGHRVSDPFYAEQIDGRVIDLELDAGPPAVPLSTAFYGHRHPRIASNSAGSFVVYQSGAPYYFPPGDGSSFGVRGRALDPTGRPVGAEFIVNSYTTNTQYETRIAPLNDGRFVVAWQSIGSHGTDQSGWSVQMRIVELDIPSLPFIDGFETGGWQHWSEIVP